MHWPPADTLIPNLTPYELLLYAAELKRPREEPLAVKQGDVERLLRKLKLADCRWVGCTGSRRT
jgi:ATP-binding cassette subfamily G (WHITE) protein 2